MQITPSVDSAMFFFGTNVLHFSEEFYGTVLLIDGIAQVVGALRRITSHIRKLLFLPLPCSARSLLVHVFKFSRPFDIGAPSCMTVAVA